MAKQRTYSIYRNVETDDMFIDKDGLHFRRYKVFACGMNKSGAEWLMSIEEDHKKFMKGENL